MLLYKALKEEIMNKEQMKIAYYNIGDKLITFFEDVLSAEDKMGFMVNVDNMTNGSISCGDMCISYIVINDNEMIYVYRDSEGMICLNTSSLDKTFTNVGDRSYFGYDQFQKEPFDFIQKVMNENLVLRKNKVKQYHI